MFEFSNEELIKRLLTARIDNYHIVNQLARGIGMWTQFQYIFRFALDRCFQEIDVNDIREAVMKGQINNPDIIGLLEEGDKLRKQTQRLVLHRTPLEDENARQGALKLLRNLEGEIEERSLWDRILRFIGIHRKKESLYFVSKTKNGYIIPSKD